MLRILVASFSQLLIARNRQGAAAKGRDLKSLKAHTNAQASEIILAFAISPKRSMLHTVCCGMLELRPPLLPGQSWPGRARKQRTL